MTSFELHPRLATDSALVLVRNHVEIRLVRQSLITWLIAVPHTLETEWVNLESSLKTQVLELQDEISNIMLTELQADKLNIALIGNVVEQMHIHIIARRHEDTFWPNVVWGEPFTDYTPAQLEQQIEFWRNRLS